MYASFYVYVIIYIQIYYVCGYLYSNLLCMWIFIFEFIKYAIIHIRTHYVCNNSYSMYYLCDNSYKNLLFM